MLMYENKITPTNWDIKWDYTMSLPENNGFEKYVYGNVTVE